MNHRFNQRNRTRGGAVLEMCLVLPILLGLAFGTIEFGYFFFVKHNIQAAAREGARAAIVPGATAQKVSDAVSQVLTAAGLSGVAYTTTVTDASDLPIDVATAPAGTSVKVSVSMNWGEVGVSPLGVLAADKTVRGATVMRKEG